MSNFTIKKITKQTKSEPIKYGTTISAVKIILIYFKFIKKKKKNQYIGNYPKGSLKSVFAY